MRQIGYTGLGIAMLWFAWVQRNDPDPWLWVTLYGVAAGLFAAALIGWSRRWAVVAVWSAYAVTGLFLLPGFLDWLLKHPWSDLVGVMSTERQYIEDSRELLGLLIAASCLLLLWFLPPQRAAKQPPGS